MDTAVTIGVIVAMIAAGAFAIHLLNAQHAERISVFGYSRFRPGRKGPDTGTVQPPDGLPGPPAGNTRRDHRDGGRGRLRPRRRIVRTRGRRA